MSLFNPNAHVFTPRVQAQPTASTSQLAPPPSTGRARRPPVVRRSPVPPQPVLCKFFNTDKGCSGKCRFVHEAPGSVGPPNAGANARRKAERVLELERRKSGRSASPLPARPRPIKVVQPVPVCKFWQRGYCTRSTECKFPHTPPSTSLTSTLVEPAAPASPVHPHSDEPSETACSICFECPDFYGLLESCSHVFCLTCIRQWRDPKKKDEQTNAKSCPLCRGKSDFVTPSSRFAAEGEDKRRIIVNYKDTMKSKPCRYFAESRKTHPFCPYGDDCFYAHLLPSGDTFIFYKTVQTSMARHKSRRTSRSAGGRGGPPTGGLGGPGGLDWFLNSMEHALIASQRPDAVANGAPTAAALFGTIGRVLGLGDGSALDAASLVDGLPPLVEINGQRPGPRAPAPARRRPISSDDASSDDEMPSLLPTSARRTQPTVVHPSAPIDFQRLVNILNNPHAASARRPTQTSGPPPLESGGDSDSSIPDLVPVPSSTSTAASASPNQPPLPIPPRSPSSRRSEIPPPRPQARGPTSAAAAAGAAASARAAIALAANPAHRRRPAYDSSSEEDVDGPPALLPASTRLMPTARRASPPPLWPVLGRPVPSAPTATADPPYLDRPSRASESEEDELVSVLPRPRSTALGPEVDDTEDEGMPDLLPVRQGAGMGNDLGSDEVERTRLMLDRMAGVLAGRGAGGAAGGNGGANARGAGV